MLAFLWFVRNALTALLLISFIETTPALVLSQRAGSHRASVIVDTVHPIRSFDPGKSLGAGIDGHGFGDIDALLSHQNIEQMLSAGLKPVTYRLRTELGNEAWHWNPEGSWSDQSQKQGYWTSD